MVYLSTDKLQSYFTFHILQKIKIIIAPGNLNVAWKWIKELITAYILRHFICKFHFDLMVILSRRVITKHLTDKGFYSVSWNTLQYKMKNKTLFCIIRGTQHRILFECSNLLY